MFHDDNADQENGQDRPNDDKNPDVELFVRDSKYAGPIDQHIHAPIEDLIHHVHPPVPMSYIDRLDFTRFRLSNPHLDSQV